jgi:predicted molibdopterin-dependent oxidoreductase YjgC
MFKRLDKSDDNRVNVTINGQPAQVPAGETVAAAVLTQGLAYTRTTHVSAAPRAPFCLMGVCFECLMAIDGKANQRACMVRVKEGMRIESQRGAGEWQT